jgi:type I restriction enzyme M protein
MTKNNQQKLGKTLWKIADQLRGAMNPDDFRDYMLSFLFLRYLSFNYEASAKKELGSDYPDKELENVKPDFRVPPPLEKWYEENEEDIEEFEKQMRRKVHYVIKPQHLWSNITELGRTQNPELLKTLEKGFRFIENKSFDDSFQGLFSEINLNSEKLGKTEPERNKKLCTIIQTIAEGISSFPTDSDSLGDAYEYLIGQFAAGSGKKAGEFYTPQQVSTILSEIVSLDSQNPSTGRKKKLNRILDFACGSGSLLLNVRKRLKDEGGSIGKIFGQEKNITTYNLARMNMLLHGMKDTEFEIFHGDTLINQWDMLNEMNPSKKIEFDAIVANPPFSLRWEPNDTLAEDFRFKSYGLAPKSAADFAFLLHGFHFLSQEGTMAIILPHGVLFRGGAEERIRTKLLKDNNIDTVIGLPANLFYSTGIPVCILVLKKCKKEDDVLFINASEEFEKGKRQNTLREGKEEGEPNDIQRIVETYKSRPEKIKRYARKVSMDEIEKNGYNLNISRYVSTAEKEDKIDLKEVNAKLKIINESIKTNTDKHNEFLKELGLPPI